MGLLVAAAITIVLALLAVAVLIARAAPPGDRGVLGLVFVLALPLQPIALYLVRLPLDAVVRAALGLGIWWGMVALVYAPFTEEPAKWLVVAVPRVRRSLVPGNAVPLALALGAGFGIGETCFLAQALVASGAYPDLPFWRFYGFMLERLEVCFLHGVFVAAPIVRLAQGKSFWPGAAVGLLLHFLTNFPIFPAQLGAFGLAGPAWAALLMGWTAGLVLLGAVVLLRVHRRLACAPLGAQDRNRAEGDVVASTQ
ncbi:MAG TPA: hypothetical protein VGF60_19330 [Xanthobacteraceae bacterium]|jgi:hypothetical protein